MAIIRHARPLETGDAQATQAIRHLCTVRGKYMSTKQNLVQAATGMFKRAIHILVKPHAAWDQIAEEQIQLDTLLKTYILPLAAIMPLATMIGIILGDGIGIQQQLGHYAVEMVVNYIFAVFAVYLVAYLTNYLIPFFGGEKNYGNALRLVAYTSTAIWLPGIFWLMPEFGKLAFILSLYCLYLGYLGLQVLMKCPEAKAFWLVIVMLIIAMTLGIITQSLKDRVFDGEQYDPHPGPFAMSLHETQ